MTTLILLKLIFTVIFIHGTNVQNIAIINANLIDGVSDDIQKDVSILINNGQIATIQIQSKTIPDT